MASFELFAPHLLGNEGGYSTDTNDKGNYYNGKFIGSKCGVSAPVLAHYLGRDITVEDMKAVTPQTALIIAKYRYWNKWLADEINNQSIAEFLVDWEYNSGYYGIEIPQKVLGVEPDGFVGQLTITAVNSADQQDLFNKLVQARLNFVENIVKVDPTQAGELVGWKNRIAKFHFSE